MERNDWSTPGEATRIFRDAASWVPRFPRRLPTTMMLTELKLTWIEDRAELLARLSAKETEALRAFSDRQHLAMGLDSETASPDFDPFLMYSSECSWSDSPAASSPSILDVSLSPSFSRLQS